MKPTELATVRLPSLKSSGNIGLLKTGWFYKGSNQGQWRYSIGIEFSKGYSGVLQSFQSFFSCFPQEHVHFRHPQPPFRSLGVMPGANRSYQRSIANTLAIKCSGCRDGGKIVKSIGCSLGTWVFVTRKKHEIWTISWLFWARNDSYCSWDVVTTGKLLKMLQEGDDSQEERSE